LVVGGVGAVVVNAGRVVEVVVDRRVCVVGDTSVVLVEDDGCVVLVVSLGSVVVVVEVAIVEVVVSRHFFSPCPYICSYPVEHFFSW
jgi:hypothetical protein